ncbi:unnamed protein product [Rodentolepis nana]|uniref:Trimethylguanosine synthase n=1 Tax=Rodentolepis nana TaxID=102285 RepID=A0A0R3TVF7_RODNA|nr:unnamed protein product [Rodentolepis nana]
MTESRIVKFDDSIFDTLSDVSSSDAEQESIQISSIAAAEDNKQMDGVQVDCHATENSGVSSILNRENFVHNKESSPIAIPSRRALKRSHKRYKEFEGMMRDPSVARWWKRRFDLFWRFDEGIKMDKESWYIVTPEEVARRQAEICTSNVVVDAYAGAGGNTIQFAQKCQFVIGIDNNLERLSSILQPNTRVYGVKSRVDCICGDVTGVLRALRTESISAIDTVFMSPPWGGPGYTKCSRLPPGSSSWNKRRRSEIILEEMTNPCSEIFDIDGQIPTLVDAVSAAKNLFLHRPSPRVAIYLPRNSSLGQLLKLGWSGENSEDSANRHEVKIEEYWLRGRRMALCVYIGDFEIPDEV